MKIQDVDQKILYELFCEVYNRATPKGDFGYLLFACQIDDERNKVIPYWEYEIDCFMLDNIITEFLLTKKITDKTLIGKYARQIRTGPCPQETNEYKSSGYNRSGKKNTLNNKNGKSKARYKPTRISR
jgi:hypothetical protein